MQKEEKPVEETNKNNSNPEQVKPNEENKEQIKKEFKTDLNQEKEKDELQKKFEILNKPKELIDFDVSLHFKENISRPDKNDLNKISNNSYYCINCKHSECPFYDDKKHLIINRAKCLLYDTHFFDKMEENINEALNYGQFKEGVKNNINEYIDKMKESLDKLKEKKFNEIDIFFEENEKNLIKLKKEYLTVRKNIEEYYQINKKFFNIELREDKDKEKNEEENDNNDKFNNIKNNNTNDENNNFIIDDIDDSSPNRDIENSVFLLNFELMNLCETKNLEHFYYMKNIKKRIDYFNETVKSNLIEDTKNISNLLNLDTVPLKYIENHYWDINIRTEKYTEIIQQFRETICDIYHRAGNLEKIKDLIDIFDSKLKKNNKIIFEQKYFSNEKTPEINNKENICNNEQNRNTVNSRKRNISASHRRASSKAKSLKKFNTVRGKSSTKYKKGDNINTINNIQTLTLSNDILLRNIIKNKNEKYNKIDTHISVELNKNKNPENKKANQKLINFQNCANDDIILDKRVIQRFFAYSISELYNKNFAKIDLNNYDIHYKILNKDNIYLNKDGKNSTPKEANNKSKTRANSSKAKGNKLLQNYMNRNKFNKYDQNNLNKNNNINNIDTLDVERIDPSNQYNIKSVSYLSNYTNRYNSLKEIAKPIIGTNQIQLFFQKNQKIIRKTTTLNKEEHGYSLFPEGCRHILIDNNLYIIGGTNHIRQPINIVLVYHILLGTLERLPDMVFPHSYHTVDYLENFDCIITIGGENSNQCEIMNLENKKWIKLPNLNSPRANANVYYNNLNSELFVLFGICGIMADKIKYSDAIEVLELKDIEKGWIIIDYYKTPGLNLKVNYCMTIPFTKEQLLIYGGSNMRSFTKNIYALFHMTKNECNKVDTQTMELIKLEEKKSRLVDLALTKLG